MKKSIFTFLPFVFILALIGVVLPFAAVQAKNADEVNLKVKNRTGGIVSLKLINENGNPSWFTYEAGQSITPLAEGIYTYYASTPCGNQSGVFNINVTKELIFSCDENIEVTLQRPVGNPACSVYGQHLTGEGTDMWFPVGAHIKFRPGFNLEVECADGINIPPFPTN